MAEVTLNGQPFPLRDEPPKAGRLMLLARAEKRGEKDAMAAYLDLLESLLHPDHDPAAFEAAVAEMEFDQIGEALRLAAESYSVDPTSAGQQSSPHSAGGQPTGGPTSKVVNFSKGTVEVTEEPRSSTA